jgi:hypothetical protein
MTKEGTDLEAFDREVMDFDRNRYAVFTSLVEELIAAGSNPEDTDFGRIFRHAQSALGKKDTELSKLFKVSRPTIGRWARGITAPHPFLRKAVYEALLVEAKQTLKGLRQPTAA